MKFRSRSSGLQSLLSAQKIMKMSAEFWHEEAVKFHLPWCVKISKCNTWLVSSSIVEWFICMDDNSSEKISKMIQNPKIDWACWTGTCRQVNLTPAALHIHKHRCWKTSSGDKKFNENKNIELFATSDVLFAPRSGGGESVSWISSPCLFTLLPCCKFLNSTPSDGLSIMHIAY